MSVRIRVLIVVALLLAGCRQGVQISRASFEASGKTWPLTVESGTVICSPDHAVFFEDGIGRRYSVNGVARAFAPELSHLDEITAVDQAILRMLRAAGDTNPFEPRPEVREIITIGLAACCGNGRWRSRRVAEAVLGMTESEVPVVERVRESA